MAKDTADICERINLFAEEILGKTGRLPVSLLLRPDEFDAVCAKLQIPRDTARIRFPVRGKVVSLYRGELVDAHT